VAIVGPPNAGKSTLYNRLILKKEDRAQVGPLPGTTRVAQEGDIGLFTLVDTPGAIASLQEQASDRDGPLAQVISAASNADVVVILFDATQAVGDLERLLFETLIGLGRPWVVALNKMDAVGQERPKIHARAAHVLGLGTEYVLPISARTGAGLERLLLEIARKEPEIVAALGQALPAYRGTLARASITRAASTAAAIALTPLPFISFIPLIGVQTALVLSLARIYGYRMSVARARELIVTFGIGLLARTLFYELVKFGGPPGWVVSAGVAAGTTTALGYGAAAWFDHGEQLSRQRLKGISRSVGTTIVGRLRGGRRPKRRELEREVGLGIEQALPEPPPGEDVTAARPADSGGQEARVVDRGSEG
jgi:small GTP-binding protein